MAGTESKVAYLPVNLSTVRLDTGKEFDLYIKVKRDKYVLYLAGENALTADELEKLVKKKVKKLYVATDQQDKYRGYVVEHLPDIIHDPGISSKMKSEIVYDVARAVVQDAFDDPRAEVLDQSKEIVASTVSLITEDESAASTLMQLTSHDFFTYTHSVNVCIYSMNLVKNLFADMSEEEFQRLGTAFILHDIGMSAIPLDVIYKKGPYTDDELQLMKTHPEEGYRILKVTGHLTVENGMVVLQHHEHFDGSGYPKGLADGEIDEFARICAIADIFDSLTTRRPMRPAMTSYEALNLMKTEMSGAFSHAHFEQFIQMFVV